MKYTITDGALTAVIEGIPYTIARDNPVYTQVRDAIEKGASDWVVVELFRTAAAVKRYMKNQVDVKNGMLFFNGEEIHNTVVDRIFEFMTEGLPVEPLILFLNRLLANPSKRSIEELYEFMRHKNLPITEEGFLLAYKGVKDDYTDVHSGRFSNKPGITNAMPRAACDPDSQNHCSRGFHVGSLEYATSWGKRTVIVKVDPADVVAVPDDHDCQKMRVCKYAVECDYAGPLPRACYKEPYEDEEVWDVESY